VVNHTLASLKQNQFNPYKPGQWIYTAPTQEYELAKCNHYSFQRWYNASP
jgi:hypothetical protein